MFATKKLTNSTSVKILKSALIEELTPVTAEQICGGAIADYPSENHNNLPGIASKDNSRPVGIGYDGLGTAPIYSPLPAAKLARLGPLDPSKRTSPRNSINITIPIPTV